MAICPSITRGDRIRITKVDRCGRPVYGECNAVVTKGIVTIAEEPQIEEGEPLEQVAFDGVEKCFSEPACASVTSRTITITWCAISFDAFLFMNPNHRAIRDDQDQIIGLIESDAIDCSAGYAVEVWSQVAGATDVCVGEEDAGTWMYTVYPWISGATPGEITIGGDEVVTYTSIGNTRTGSKWGTGPYQVAIVDGIPDGMPIPFDPDGKEAKAYFVTTVTPPPIDCECQEVPRPIPDPADLVVTGIANEQPRQTVQIRVDNHGLGPVIVCWDGSGGGSTGYGYGDCEEAADLSTVSHKYPVDQAEANISVCDAQDVTVCRELTLPLPLPPDEPGVTVVSAATDQKPNQVKAIASLPPQAEGGVIFDWGDGKTTEGTAGPDGMADAVHDYANPGRYRVCARRKEKQSLKGCWTISVPMPIDG